MPQETLTLLLAAGWGGKEGSGGRPWVPPPPEARDGLEAEKAPKERAAAILSKRSAGQESREQHQVGTRAPSPIPGGSAPAPAPQLSPCCSPEPLPQPRSPPPVPPVAPRCCTTGAGPSPAPAHCFPAPSAAASSTQSQTGQHWDELGCAISTGWGSQGPRRDPCFGEGQGAFGCASPVPAATPCLAPLRRWPHTSGNQ